ncbi:unnamed protein product [Rotaria sp. Silwood2]|nr:unnamed protein product [Rotaria sp. Silwood2]CAF4592601.1 unnamed protein product [Rotaria sp. Silwood2]
MTHQRFVATSNKYPTLIGTEFDTSKGVYILIKIGEVVAQDNSSFKLVSMIPDQKTNVTDEFQIANLLLVPNDRYFIQHLHYTGATISCIPEVMNPFPIDATSIDIETGAGIKRQKLTKVQIVIDEHIYNIMACIN